MVTTYIARFPEITTFISLSSIIHLAITMKTQCIICEVGTELLLPFTDRHSGLFPFRMNLKLLALKRVCMTL
jgi:hypothetical protein